MWFFFFLIAHMHTPNTHTRTRINTQTDSQVYISQIMMCFGGIRDSRAEPNASKHGKQTNYHCVYVCVCEEAVRNTV